MSRNRKCCLSQENDLHTTECYAQAAPRTRAPACEALTDEMIAAEAERRYASCDIDNADRWVIGFMWGAKWARDRMAQPAAQSEPYEHDGIVTHFVANGSVNHLPSEARFCEICRTASAQPEPYCLLHLEVCEGAVVCQECRAGKIVVGRDRMAQPAVTSACDCGWMPTDGDVKKCKHYRERMAQPLTDREQKASLMAIQSAYDNGAMDWSMVAMIRDVLLGKRMAQPAVTHVSEADILEALNDLNYDDMARVGDVVPRESIPAIANAMLELFNKQRFCDFCGHSKDEHAFPGALGTPCAKDGCRCQHYYAARDRMAQPALIKYAVTPNDMAENLTEMAEPTVTLDTAAITGALVSTYIQGPIAQAKAVLALLQRKPKHECDDRCTDDRGYRTASCPAR